MHCTNGNSAPELIFDSVFFIYSDTACEQTLASLESKKEDFERYKTRLAVVRKEKEKRKLELIGKHFSYIELYNKGR